MSVVAHQIRRGAYADSIVLMQLQSALAGLDGVEDAGAVMATEANLELLAANALLPAGELDAGASDLLVVVRATSEETAAAALAAIDRLTAREKASESTEFRPRSLRTAFAANPDARWVSVSVPGPYAADVARQALAAGRHVFLYSDNVPIAAEVELKREAARRGLLVMGPDCGTAILGGVGFGFANRVRRGAIGVVAASGTGLQAVTSRIDELGAGISQAIGTGGRDLAREVGGATAIQALDLLARDPETRVIVLISKPPAPEVAARVLLSALASVKPVVVAMSGAALPVTRLDHLTVATSLRDAADRAVALLETSAAGIARATSSRRRTSLVRGLFSGGTLAAEAVAALQYFLVPLASNLKATADLARPGHLILDLGADEFTVGRPHPMIDQELVIERIAEEAARPETGLILLDLVLGDGAHPDPATRLAPVIRQAIASGAVEIGVLVVGTGGDPQDLGAQIERLTDAGATVFRSTEELARFTVERYAAAPGAVERPVELDDLAEPATINVGLEHFHASLHAQGAPVVHVDWRPPAGGDERLQALLSRMG